MFHSTDIQMCVCLKNNHNHKDNRERENRFMWKKDIVFLIQFKKIFAISEVEFVTIYQKKVSDQKIS